MATLTATTVTRTGHLTTGAAAGASGDKWANTGYEFLLVTNAHATDARTVTLDIKSTIDGATVTDPTVAVAALTTKIIGPFPSVYNDVDGNVNVTYTNSGADLTVKVIKCVGA